jgi:hypothetical protein
MLSKLCTNNYYRLILFPAFTVTSAAAGRLLRLPLAQALAVHSGLASDFLPFYPSTVSWDEFVIRKSTTCYSLNAFGRALMD